MFPLCILSGQVNQVQETVAVDILKRTPTSRVVKPVTVKVHPPSVSCVHIIGATTVFLWGVHISFYEIAVPPPLTTSAMNL
jgi:hypothetical protein